MTDYFNSISQQIRHWLNLLSESKFDSSAFSQFDYDLLEQYGYPIMGAIESINDPSTESEELESIKMFIEILLADGGLWGETFNSHDVVTTQLKQKIIELYNSL